MPRCLGGAALAGALLLISVSSAHADGVRDGQWVLGAYQARETVWPRSTGAGVTVAVIDSGVRATHVDLQGAVLPGMDFAFGGDGRQDHSADGHGTGMASIIAGRGHGPNGQDGIIGLAPGAKILPVGIGEGVGGRGLDYVPQAIRYAVDHGAKVISMSFGSPAANPAEEAAVAYAERHDVVLVAAAGNDGSTRRQYPASWPGVVKVSAVDENNKLWSGSTTGGVTVAAPGAHILRAGDASDTQVVSASGSSDAAAYVAAIAALVRSAHPELTAGQTIATVIRTAAMPQGHTAPDPGLGYGIARPDLGRVVDPGAAAGPLPRATVPPGTGLADWSWSLDASSAPADGSGTWLSLLLRGVFGALGVAGIVLVDVALRRKRRPKASALLPDAT
ncbi:subtilisin family serine protease [Streptacidiphilus sp. MAP12-33]|uniref:S8 family serine peptidase n=1 Tax=Streptacidiphilus sp. MAP12-33 TaxID=3156266 RepID=UPI00351748BA